MRTILTIALLLLATTTRAAIDTSMFIGNSLTNDTVVNRIAGTTWHIDCGKSLPFIEANPDNPCVASSTLWPTALASQQFDALVVQPHYDTVAANVATISNWMAMQPNAVLVIHQAWGPHATFADEYYTTQEPTDDAVWTRSPVFYDNLAERLHAIDPGREIRFSGTADALEIVRQDIAAGVAPFDSFDELYRDDIHLGTGSHDSEDASGRYLAHNMMRAALGQEISAVGFDNVPLERREYLNGVVARATAVPEASQLLALSLAGLIAVVTRLRR